MHPHGIRRAVGVLLAILLVASAGCATLRGLGEDLQSLGRGIKRVFSE